VLPCFLQSPRAMKIPVPVFPLLPSGTARPPIAQHLQRRVKPSVSRQCLMAHSSTFTGAAKSLVPRRPSTLERHVSHIPQPDGNWDEESQ
jgi:hypothetical protein